MQPLSTRVCRAGSLAIALSHPLFACAPHRQPPLCENETWCQLSPRLAQRQENAVQQSVELNSSCNMAMGALAPEPTSSPSWYIELVRGPPTYISAAENKNTANGITMAAVATRTTRKAAVTTTTNSGWVQVPLVHLAPADVEGHERSQADQTLDSFQGHHVIVRERQRPYRHLRWRKASTQRDHDKDERGGGAA